MNPLSNIIQGMPCHITAMGDEREPNESLLDERMEELKEIDEIAKALLNGDKFKVYGGHIVDFSSVVDDELTCNPEYANALRKLMNVGDHIANTFEAAEELRDVVNKAVNKVAESIFEDRE